jgi:hypothetical protein
MVVAEAVRWIKFIDLFVIDIFRYSRWRKSEQFNRGDLNGCLCNWVVMTSFLEHLCGLSGNDVIPWIFVWTEW